MQCGEKIIYLCMFNAIVAIREDRIDPDGGLPLGFYNTGSTEYGYVCLFKYSTDIQNKLCYFSKRGQSTESFLTLTMHLCTIMLFFADAKSHIPSRE